MQSGRGVLTLCSKVVSGKARFVLIYHPASWEVCGRRCGFKICSAFGVLWCVWRVDGSAENVAAFFLLFYLTSLASASNIRSCCGVAASWAPGALLPLSPDENQEQKQETGRQWGLFLIVSDNWCIRQIQACYQISDISLSCYLPSFHRTYSLPPTCIFCTIVCWCRS